MNSIGVRHGLPAGNNRQNQLYSGQLPTIWSANFGFVTYDLSRYGVPDGQVMVGGTYLTTNWNPLGPRTSSLATAMYYQTLFNKAVELKIGYVANSLEFLGTYVGGSLAGGVFGPNASIPVEQGENSTVFSTPGINVKVNLPANLYTKLGVQRAISPDGTVVEHNQNPSAVRFKVPNAGVSVIDETGYQVPAAPGVMRTWVRAAASYTSSNYRDYSFGFLLPAVRSDHNYGLYLLADRQLLQTAPHTGTAAQGIYAGFSVMYAPPALNRFSQYYEARLYGVGLIPNRPTDLLSLVLTDNVFSSDVVNTARRLRLPTHDNSLAFTASYSAHVYPGVNLNAGVSYINNPTSVTYTGSTGSALNILLGTVTFF